MDLGERILFSSLAIVLLEHELGTLIDRNPPAKGRLQVTTQRWDMDSIQSSDGFSCQDPVSLRLSLLFPEFGYVS